MKEMNPEEKIMEATLEVVKENTISGTRMHLIAERADMVQSNLHYYFKTKNDLMQALQKKVLNHCLELRNQYSAKAEDTLESQIDVFIKQKMDFILKEQNYDFAEIDFWVQGRINDTVRKDFVASFATWREDIGSMLDKYAPTLSADKRAYLPYIMVSMMEGASIQYLINPGGFDIKAYFDSCKELVINSVREK